jgi:anaerobic ribonucleoside-triphosphate reductase activating protein
MNYANIEYNSVVDGDGIRVSLFVSGCLNHCRGCFNPDTWDFGYGKPFTPIEENEIIEASRPRYIAGISILGGEPFELRTQEALLPFIERYTRELPGKSLWMYTGYVLEKDLTPGGRRFVPDVTPKILSAVDVLVDGPFVLEKRDLTLRFRGSSNQRVLSRADIARILEGK